VAADVHLFDVIGCGDIRLDLPNGDGMSTVVMKDVLHAPSMAATLISVPQIDAAGYWAIFGGGKCVIDDPQRKKVVELPMVQGLYQSAGDDCRGEDRANMAAQKLTLSEAHRVLGHISHGAVRDGINHGYIHGIVLDESGAQEFCDPCAKAKFRCKSFPQMGRHRAKEIREHTHMDLWGLAPVDSLGQNLYALDLVNCKTRYTKDNYQSMKDQCFGNNKAYDKAMETQCGVRLKTLQMDCAGEFLSNEFKDYLHECGTKRELTVHNTHEQVGVVEHLNQTKVGLMRAMLFDSSLASFLWAEAMHHTIWIKNRTPTKALDGMTPFEAMFGDKPNFADVFPFGTHCWVKVLNASKIELQARLGYFVGYDDES
jgi:hypothetical protein